jgi:hypothetical protein
VFSKVYYEDKKWKQRSSDINGYGEVIELVIPRHTQMCCRYRSNKKLVLIYEHLGSRDEGKFVEVPHCELITGLDESDNNVTRIMDDMYTTIVQRQDDIYIGDMIKNRITGQIIDSFGKMRVVQVDNGDLIPILPCAPINVSEILIPESSARLTRYNTNKKLATCLKSYFYWLFSQNLDLTNGKNIDKLVSEFCDKNVTMAGESYQYNIPPVTHTKSYSSMIRGDNIIVNSRELLDKLKYVLSFDLQFKSRYIIDYKNFHNIQGYYQSIYDFDARSGQSLGNVMYPSINERDSYTINYTIDPTSDTFFFKNKYIDDTNNIYVAKQLPIPINMDDLVTELNIIYLYQNYSNIKVFHNGGDTKYVIYKINNILRGVRLTLFQRGTKSIDDTEKIFSSIEYVEEHLEIDEPKYSGIQRPLRNTGVLCHFLSLIHLLAYITDNSMFSTELSKALSYVRNEASFSSADYRNISKTCDIGVMEDPVIDLQKLYSNDSITKQLVTKNKAEPEGCGFVDDLTFAHTLSISTFPSEATTMSDLIDNYGLKVEIGSIKVKNCYNIIQIRDIPLDRYLIISMERGNRKPKTRVPVSITKQIRLDIDGKKHLMVPRAIVIHSAPNKHYIAIVHNIIDSKWYLYNDYRKPIEIPNVMDYDEAGLVVLNKTDLSKLTPIASGINVEKDATMVLYETTSITESDIEKVEEDEDIDSDFSL